MRTESYPTTQDLAIKTLLPHKPRPPFFNSPNYFAAAETLPYKYIDSFE